MLHIEACPSLAYNIVGVHWYEPRMEVILSTNDSIDLKSRIETIPSAAHSVAVSARRWKQFYLRLILFQYQATDWNNSIRGSYCFSVKLRIETILSAAHIVLLSHPEW